MTHEAIPHGAPLTDPMTPEAMTPEAWGVGGFCLRGGGQGGWGYWPVG